MQILILGDTIDAMSVCKTLAEANDVRIIGEDPTVMANIEKSIDCQVIHDNPLKQEAWEYAQIQECDTVIALMQQEEKNIIACQIISQSYKTALSICNIGSNYYPMRSALFNNNSTTQHVTLSAAHLTSLKLQQMLQHQHCEEVITSSTEQFCVLSIKLSSDAAILGNKLNSLTEHLDKQATLIGVYRDNILQEDKELIFKENDSIIIAQAQHLDNSITYSITGKHNPYQEVMIAGGSDIAICLLANIYTKYAITLIEPSLAIAEKIATLYPDITVIHGNINDDNLLVEEGITECDVFIALSQDDENNLASALQASNHGVNYVLTLVNQQGLIPVIEHTPIDCIISSQNILTDHINRHTQPGAIQTIQHLNHQHGIIVELILPQHLDGTKLDDWELEGKCICFGLLRQQQTISITAKQKYKVGDHFHIFIAEHRDLNKLFTILKP